MNIGIRYLVAGLGILVLLAILAWMNYYNKASNQVESKDSFEENLERDVASLMRELGISGDYHYMVSYRYLHPLLNLAVFPPIFDILMTQIYILVVTPDEILLRRLGNGVNFTKARPAGLRQGLVRIARKDIQKFSVRNWKKWYFFGYFMTIKTASQTYYLQVREGQGMDSSARQFRDWKTERFMGLVTEDATF